MTGSYNVRRGGQQKVMYGLEYCFACRAQKISCDFQKLATQTLIAWLLAWYQRFRVELDCDEIFSFKFELPASLPQSWTSEILLRPGTESYGDQPNQISLNQLRSHKNRGLTLM